MREAVRAAGLALAMAGSAPAAAGTIAQEHPDWVRPMAPFRIVGETYYAGTAELAAYLIKTPDGDILIDGTLPENVPLIERNIKALGEPLSRVKILLNTHAHNDHAGGLAQIKRDTGATLYASAGDAPILEAGRISFGPSADMPFPPVHPDHIVKDGAHVALGGVVLTAHLTPGHTPGCTTWTWDTREAGKTYRVIDICSITVAGNPLVHNPAYPQIASDYRASIAKLKTMQADVFLGPHASFYDMTKKRAAMKPGVPNPFIDASALPLFMGAAERNFEAEFARQQAAKQ